MELAQGIHCVTTPLGDRYSNVYLLVGSTATLLFDVGMDGMATTELRSYMTETGLSVDALRYAVISHADVDHFGGLASVRDLSPGVVLAAHVEDAPLIEDYEVYRTRRGDQFGDPWGVHEHVATLEWTREVTREGALDMYLKGGERLRLGPDWVVEVLHAPGHSRGHLALWDERSRSLIVSDAVLSDAVLNADGTPAFPPTYRYVDDYLATIARFERIAPTLLLTAHYPTMADGEVTAFLARSRTFAEGLEAAVLAATAAVGPDGITLADLLAHLNPLVGTWPAEGTDRALAFPVVGHLERLVRSGALDLVQDGHPARVRIPA